MPPTPPRHYALTASLTREGSGYVAQCLELDVASQGQTAISALRNLREALELHFEDSEVPALPSALIVRLGVWTDAHGRIRTWARREDDPRMRLGVVWCDRCGRAINLNDERDHFHFEQCGCCRRFQRIDTDWGWCKNHDAVYCGRRVFEHDTCSKWVEGSW